MNVERLPQGRPGSKKSSQRLLVAHGSEQARIPSPIEVHVYTAKLGIAEFDAVKFNEAVAIPDLGFCETKLDFAETTFS